MLHQIFLNADRKDDEEQHGDDDRDQQSLEDHFSSVFSIQVRHQVGYFNIKNIKSEGNPSSTLGNANRDNADQSAIQSVSFEGSGAIDVALLIGPDLPIISDSGVLLSIFGVGNTER